MIDKIDEYQNISQIGNALQTLMDGIEEHVNNLQQGISRSASVTSYTLDHVSNASDRYAKISISNNSDDNNSKKRERQSLLRLDTNLTNRSNNNVSDRKDGGNLEYNREEDSERPSSTVEVRRDHANAIRNSPLSPNLPRANIVSDDQDELTKDRDHIAAIRHERVISWAVKLDFQEN